MLIHETNNFIPGYQVGDLKIAHYTVPYLAFTITEPTNDTGWFLLNGAILSQTTYTGLFAKFGTAYNTGGEGAGNFRLPNLTEGGTPIGKGLTNFTSRGVSGGEINHVLTSGEIALHNHSHNLGWSSSGNHSHTPSANITSDGSDSHTHLMTNSEGTGSRTAKGTVNKTATNSNYTAGTGGASANHYHAITLFINNAASTLHLTGGVSNSSGGGAHNNMQPYIVVGGWLVKHG